MYVYELIIYTSISLGGGEAPACPQDLSLEQSSPDSEELSSSRGYTKLSSLPHGVSASSVMVGGAMISPLSEVSSVESFKDSKESKVYVDDYTKLLCADDARMLVDLLKLAVTGRCSDRSRESLSTVLSALGATNALVGDMLLELCVTELEDVATDTERLKSVPHPVTQESSHPYTDDAMLTGHVRIPGAESLRVEFDRQCSTERRHDPLTIMDGTGRIVSIRSGREWSDWSPELRVTGDELKWKFNSDGSVNGWGWRFTVYPVMPASGPHNAQSDRSVLSRPSMDLVMWLLDALMASSPDKQIGARLAAALAACAQLSALPASQRMWSLQSLRRLMMTTNYGLSLNIMSESQSSNSVSSPMDSTEVMPATPVILRPLVSDTALAVLVKGLPEMLLRQYEYEDPIGKLFIRLVLEFDK